MRANALENSDTPVRFSLTLSFPKLSVLILHMRSSKLVQRVKKKKGLQSSVGWDGWCLT